MHKAHYYFNKAHYYFIGNIGTVLHTWVARGYPYHLALAQLAEASPEYLQWYRDFARRRGNRLILDNGAHEGIDVDLDEYKRVVDQMVPHVVVLPDLVGRPTIESRRRAMEFAEWVMKCHPDMEMMYPAQGQSQQDILTDYRWALRELDPNRFVIGFGQSYLTWECAGQEQEKARLQLFRDLLRTLGGPITGHRTHILGGRWEPAFMFSWFTDLNVTGLDTIKPVTCCQCNTFYPVRVPDARADRFSGQPVNDTELRENINRVVDCYGLNLIDWSAIQRRATGAPT